MATSYLDNNGVLYLWGKIKEAFAKKTDIPTDNASLANGAGYQTSANVESAITAKGYTTMAAVEDKGYTTMTAVEGKGYQTSSQVSAAITAALADVSGVEFTIVEQLPATGTKGTIYLVKKTATAAGNIYTEYIWVNNAWEIIGDTTIDLSNYLQKSDIVAITNEEIDTIVTGS